MATHALALIKRELLLWIVASPRDLLGKVKKWTDFGKTITLILSRCGVGNQALLDSFHVEKPVSFKALLDSFHVERPVSFQALLDSFHVERPVSFQALLCSSLGQNLICRLEF